MTISTVNSLHIFWNLDVLL